MTTYAAPSYRFEFQPDDLDDIVRCNREHGFAIVKGVLPAGMVNMLKAEVQRVMEPQAAASPDATHTHFTFFEASPVAASLLTYEPLMRIARALADNEPITLNRTAAIYKQPGSFPMAWHTDAAQPVPPYNYDNILNSGDAHSLWFYLNGIDPVRGGLSVIPGSHAPDWPGPEGFVLTEGRKTFYRQGGKPAAHADMNDVPGAVPVVAEPGDLVTFAQSTYHGVYPHRGTETRLSVGLGFRKTGAAPKYLWPLPESAKRFIDFCPQEARQLVENYWGLDRTWSHPGDET